jgi:hypothetical protein
MHDLLKSRQQENASRDRSDAETLQLHRSL